MAQMTFDDITYAAKRLAGSYKDILASDDLALDTDLLLIDRSILMRPEGATKDHIAARVDVFWRTHAEQFNQAMKWWHNPDFRAVHGITDRQEWWWWPIDLDGGE